MPRDRRGAYSEQVVRSLFARMRQELDEVTARHASEVARLQAKVVALRAEVDELRSIALARQRGD